MEKINITFKGKHVAEYTKEDVEKLSPIEYSTYFEFLKQYRDLKNSLDTAKADGKAEGFAEGLAKRLAEGEAIGLEKGKREIVINSHNKGFDIETIADITNLTIEQVNDILKK